MISRTTHGLSSNQQKLNKLERSTEICEQDRRAALHVLDEELGTLPALQMEAVILRYLQGLSEKEASARAGCAPNTLSRRASNGIAKLRTQLVKRGCALGVPALIGVLEAEAQAAVPETLIPSLMAVPKLAAAGAVAGTASANIIFLMEGALKTMAITKIKKAGIGILIALLIGTTGIVAVIEIQKRQATGASENPDIVASPAKQKAHDQSKPSSAKVKQPLKARNFQAEIEEALARSPKDRFGYFPELDKIMREWFDYDKDGAIEWTLRMTDRRRIHVLGIVASEWAMEDPVAASEWVMKLPEGKNKDQHLNNVVAIWAEREPDKARNWIEKSSLSQDEKDKLLKSIPKK